MHGLGANEKAILERIPVVFLRKMAAGLVRAKMRVQFTGWLQYLLPMIFVFLFSVHWWASVPAEYQVPGNSRPRAGNAGFHRSNFRYSDQQVSPAVSLNACPNGTMS